MHRMRTDVLFFTLTQIPTILSCGKMKTFRHQTDKVLGPFMDFYWHNKLMTKGTHDVGDTRHELDVLGSWYASCSSILPTSFRKWGDVILQRSI